MKVDDKCCTYLKNSQIIAAFNKVHKSRKFTLEKMQFSLHLGPLCTLAFCLREKRKLGWWWWIEN